jgi:hypothetical protein
MVLIWSLDDPTGDAFELLPGNGPWAEKDGFLLEEADNGGF